MTLINNITGSLITNLSGGSGASSSSAGSSTINGQGVSATFGGDRVNLQSGLAAGKQAFTNSFLRTGDAFSKFQVTQQAVGNLLALTDELIDLAERAGDPQSTAQERSRINSQYQIKRDEFKTILRETEVGGVDLLDKSDLAGVLKDAGIDPEAASFLSQTFKSVAGSDDVVGFAKLVSEALDTQVVITGTNEIIIPGTTVENQISRESANGGTGVISGQIINNEGINGSLNSLFNTATDYGSNPSGLAVIQSASTGGVGGDAYVASYNESIEIFDRADTDVTLSVVGDGENARFELYDISTGDAVGDALKVGDRTALSGSIDAAIDQGGDYFVYTEGTSLQFSSTADYELDGTLNSLSGSVAGGLDAAGTGFIFVSSDVAFGGDGATLDLFYADSYLDTATITNVTNGSYGDVDLDSVAISNDGSTILFTDGSQDLFQYTTGDQGITQITGVSRVESVTINSDASAIAIAFDDGTDVNVGLYSLSAAVATQESSVDLNLGAGSSIVEDLSLNDAGDAVAFVVSSGFLEGADEVFVLETDGSGAGVTPFTIGGTIYSLGTNGGEIRRAADLTENGGSTRVDRAFIDRSTAGTVSFSTIADLNSGNPEGLRVTTTVDTVAGTPATQDTTVQENFKFLDVNENGKIGLTVKELEDGNYKIDLYNLETTTLIDSLVVTDEDPFNAINDISTAISSDGTSAVIRGLGTQVEGSESLLFADGAFLVSTGNFEGEVALSDTSTAFFSDATEFGATDGTFDLIVGQGNTSTALEATLNFDRYTIESGDAFDTDVLSVSKDGSIIATASETDGFLQIIDTSTNEVLEIQEARNVQAVAVSDDGSRVAIVAGNGAAQTVKVYQISNAPGTNDLEYDELYNQVELNRNYDNVAINGDGTLVSAVGDDPDFGVAELYVYRSDENFQDSFEEVSSVEPPVEPQTGTDPLNQDLSTIGGAQIAAITLNELRDEITSDLGKIDSIVEELRGAVEFALAGARAFDDAASSSDVPSPEKLASDLVSQIRNATGDSMLGAHSSLDLILAKELLG